NRFDPVTNAVAHFGKGTRDFQSLIKNAGWDAFNNGNSGWCAYATDDGLVWLSTQQDSKLFKIDLYNNEIPFYSDEGDVIAFFEESGNVFWKGTYNNGLIREDKVENTSKKFLHEPKDPNSISNNVIHAICKDHLDQFWIGTNVGLNKFDPFSGKFKRYLPDPDDPAAISSPVVNVINEDSNFNLWIGTGTGGLNLLDQKTGEFRQFKHNPRDQNSLSGDNVSTILEDKKGALWIGVVDNGSGVNQFKPFTQTFKRYMQGLTVTNLLIDDNDVLWAGTSNGLYKYDPDTDQFENANITFNITEVINDTDNNLWLYNSNGILRYDQQTGNTMLYGEKNGVQGILEITQYAPPYRKTDGTIFFGGFLGGYYAFSPDKLWVSRDTSLLYFTDFRIQGASAFAGTMNFFGESMVGGKEITLEHNQNVFSLQFTAIDYRNSQDNPLYYMLENYDPDWLQADAENPVNYFKVPPGEYVFKIKAANSSSGIWSEKSIRLVIHPPWWTTWWAYLIYGLLFVGAVLVTHRFQKARVIRKERERIKDKELAQAKEIEKAYSELKTTQAQLIQSEKMASLGELTAGIAHEIQNPLNFVNNFSEVNKELLVELEEEIQKGNYDEVQALAKDVIDNEEKIIFHGKRADAIVKGMLQHSRSSSGVREPTDINVLADEYLRLAYHGLRAKDKSFNAKLETDFDTSIKKINIVAQDVGRVILNLITNAFYVVKQKKEQQKENYEPTVSVRTKKNKDTISISVKDNGNGIPKAIKEKIFQPFFTTKPSGEGTGLGLSLSYDIVKSHGGELKVETKEGEGTEFTIILPIIQTKKL
ncbi:MAG: ATP-binding protein, partial [Flavobacteriaceae bacterium]